jgi:hypothetical protein
MNRVDGLCGDNFDGGFHSSTGFYDDRVSLWVPRLGE